MYPSDYNQVTELLVSTFDPGEGKTIWQCAQCHFSSKVLIIIIVSIIIMISLSTPTCEKVRFNVKRHIETHIENFAHQCPHCDRTSKTRNALQVWFLLMVMTHNEVKAFINTVSRLYSRSIQAHIMRSHTGRPQTLVQQQQEHLGAELEPGSGPGWRPGFKEGSEKSPEGIMQVVLVY